MIRQVSGQIVEVTDGQVSLRAGSFTFEIAIPASDQSYLAGREGAEQQFHTLFYLEGDAARGSLAPRLIGFVRPEDRDFFVLFTTVKGIGPKTALRALDAPTHEIAGAIERRDARALTRLNGIGKRTAELIIAELSGKLGRFVADQAPAMTASAPDSDETDAAAAMVALGERRDHAEQLIARAKRANPSLKGVEAILAAALRLK
jgi:Holliday junction DNA helicase RuvA